MAIIRPRLNDYYNIPFRQEDVDFAIPFLDEDIPLYVDPFLLWKIPSMQDNSLHTSLLASFNSLGYHYSKGNETEAVQTLISLTECDEVGLGSSKNKKGKKIGEAVAHDVLNLFKAIPQINKDGFNHFEEIQLLVDNISKDRISDITCSIIKSFLIDYTIDQCKTLGIPLDNVEVGVFDLKKQKTISEKTYLPVNPENKQPILFVPKRWLRYSPWLNYDDYFNNYYITDIDKAYDGKLNRVQILNFNRHNYDLVKVYTTLKEKNTGDCKNDPLFTQIPVLSTKRKVKTINALATGKIDNADKEYEDNMVQLLASMLYPHLDFAAEQSRTDSGSHVRDLIFYNNRTYDFLQEIYDTYDSRQLVFELKNVAVLEGEHINQLNRYLTEQFGRFGIIFTRKPPPKNIIQNTVNLWSAHRRCIIILDDSDLELMAEVYESKQRLPIDIVKRRYIEFTRKFPS